MMHGPTLAIATATCLLGVATIEAAQAPSSVPDWVTFPEEEWQTITPEEAGIEDVAAWDGWVEAARQKARGAAFQGEDHSGNKWGVAIARGGYLVETFGDPDYRYQTASLGKAFNRACLQLAVDDGLIPSTDALIKDYWTGADELNSPHKYLDKGHHNWLSFGHLADHTGGFPITNGWSWQQGKNYSVEAPKWAKCTNDPDYDNYSHARPGEVGYSYSSGGYWRLAQALTALWGKDLKDVLDEKLFVPMGIPPDRWEWTPGHVVREREDFYPRMPGYGLFIDPPHSIDGNVVRGGQWVVMSAKDLARYGLLVATGGVWNGERLIGRAVAGGGGNGSEATGIGGNATGSVGIVTSTFKGVKIPWHLFTRPPAPGLPHVEFTASAITGETPLEVNFAEASSARAPATISKWVWDFGDGATSTDRSPSHTYKKPGTYRARLTVTDSEGRKATRQVTIAVAGPDTLPPTIRRAVAAGDPRKATVVFSETVERVSAERLSNYRIDDGVSVARAQLQPDGKTVILATPPHRTGPTYTLSVANVRDRARNPNMTRPGTETTYRYTPLPRQGLRLWLKPNAGITRDEGGRVSTWRDQSGHGHDATQPDPAARPALAPGAANGLPALRFDGKSSWMSGTVGAIRAPLTVLLVGYFEQVHQPAGDYDYLINIGRGAAGPNLSISRFAGGDARGERDSYYCRHVSGTNLLGSPLEGRTWQVIAVTHDTDAPRHRLFVNGVAQPVLDDPEALIPDGAFTLGRWSSTGIPHFLDGAIAEALVYADVLAPPEREAVERYLMAKYAIASGASPRPER